VIITTEHKSTYGMDNYRVDREKFTENLLTQITKHSHKQSHEQKSIKYKKNTQGSPKKAPMLKTSLIRSAISTELVKIHFLVTFFGYISPSAFSTTAPGEGKTSAVNWLIFLEARCPLSVT